jgi:hypothetical protein
MPAWDQGTAIMLLNGASGQSSYVATTAPVYLRLMISAPTSPVTGTELPGGGGYTTGGKIITWGAPTGTPSGAIMLNTNALTWTNSGVASWTLVGLELWDSAGTPKRLAYGLWDDQPLTIGPGSPFPVAIAGLGWAIP